jgi:CheY-like chemotaxis protein
MSSDRTESDERAAFVLSLPRKVTELRATLGTIVADARSVRMRDELRRRMHALYTLTRSHSLSSLSEGLREGIAQLDALRASAQLSQRDLDNLSETIASLTTLAQNDLPDRPELFERPRDRGPSASASIRPGTSATASPSLNAIGTAKSQSIRPSSFGTAPVGILVVGGPHLIADVRRASSKEAELTVVKTLAEAVSAARDLAPDLIIAESAPPSDAMGLLQALRGDPLTDFLPVLVITAPSERLDENELRVQGAFDVIHTPVNPDKLTKGIARALDNVLRPSAPPPALGDVTLEELTKALQEELRRGLMGAAGPSAGGARVPLGQGSEVLAATWEAIARVREVVAKRTHGRVRFERPAAPQGLGGAHVLAVGDDDDSPPEVEGEDPLPGRKALVVDDDPNVVWFFAGLLRDAGMQVVECTDGSQALVEARKTHPDVVISDILMPGLDGFALCRAIRRDVALRFIPVVLLSWREDLITRMRELGAQAQGYLRKESKGEAILARVRSVIRARIKLLQRIETLGESDELRGRVERVGAFTLVETVARALRGATIAMTDSFSVTEIELRGGRLVSVIRTAQDGSLTRGEPALISVLGASSARFTLKRATHAVRSNLHGELDALLDGSAAAISALEDAVSGASLVEVSSLEMDNDAAAAYADTLPEKMRTIVQKMIAGASPRDLVLRDGIAPQDIDPLLVELARRGVIRGVRGGAGEDLVAPRKEARKQEWRQGPPTGRVSTTMPAILLPQDVPTAQLLLTPTPATASPTPAATLDSSAKLQSKPPQSAIASPSLRAGADRKSDPASAPRPSSPPWKRPTTIDEAAQPGFGEAPERDSLADAVLAELGDHAELFAPATAAVSSASSSATPAPDAVASPPTVQADVKAPNDTVDMSDAKRTAPVEQPSVDPTKDRPLAGRDVSGERPTAPALVVEDDGPLVEQSAHDEATLSPDEVEAAAAASPGILLDQVELDSRGLPRRRARTQDIAKVDQEHVPVRVSTSNSSIIVDQAAVGAPVEIREPKKKPSPVTEELPVESSSYAWLWLIVIVLGLGVGSFWVVRLLMAQDPSPSSANGTTANVHALLSDGGPEPDQASSTEPEAVAPADDSATESAGPTPATAEMSPDLEPAPFLDGGVLTEGRGLVVIEGDGHIYLGTREVGDAPLQQVLAPGQYNLTYQRGAIRGFRVIDVRANRAVRLVLPQQP